MDKIRQLLEQLGSKELSDQIIESFEAHTKTVRAKLDEEYKARLQRAKQVCLEEVEKYKDELGRKAQIFFESRANAIERQIANQVAIKESAAETKLRKVAALLEGIEVDGKQVDKAALQATLKQVRDLQKQLKVVTESRKVLAEKANRANEIAQKALERNQYLEESLRSKETIEEDKDKAKVVNEDTEDGKTSEESKKTTLNESKKAGTPKTTRPATDESIRKPQAPATQRMGGYSIEAIASQID